MSAIKIQVWIFMLVLIPAYICATTLQHYPLAKANCVDKCGDVNIPYPFGTTENCYRNRSFLVTCNETISPPQLYLRNSTVRITDISLSGQLKVMAHMAKTCYYPNGTSIVHNMSRLRLPKLFAVNNTANKFTVVGCDSYGYINGWRGWGRYFSTGCIARCDQREDIEDGSCMGTGCCQMSQIPQDIWSANVTANSFDNHTNVNNFSSCTYAFLVEDKAFKFSRDNLTNLLNVDRLPIVVDWVLANETCELAQKNSSSYGCISNYSNCLKPTGGEGYTCECESGYQGNPYLNDGCKDINECDVRELNNCTFRSRCENFPGGFKCHCPKGYRGSGIGEGSCTRTFILVEGFVVGISIIAMLVICLLYMELKRRKSKKRKDMLFLQNGGKLLQDKLKAAGGREFSPDGDPIAKIYSSKDLEIATNKFDRNMIVGQGGFGTVYKGIFEDKRIVAIKKSNKVDPTQIEQFINEFFVLSRISHKNAVKLLGCCLETEVPLLVYEFINNGTLYDHIHNQEKKCLLDWNLRLKIATETADVLWYLHSAATSTPIVHRDVKSANILLDNDFKAKVSDFGGSRLVPVDHTQLPTVVLGTRGYLDPEYMQTEELTEKSDVYSFGVVLVELITGRKAIDYDKPDKEKCVASYFKCKLKEGRLNDILDETIVWDESSEKQVTGVAKIAQLCLNMRGEDRPTMKEVAVELEGLKTGRTRSWTNLENISEEFGSSSAKGFDEVVDVSGYNTSVCYDTKFSGGR